MDEDLKKLLDEARSQGANEGQLQGIVDAYKKKNPNGISSSGASLNSASPVSTPLSSDSSQPVSSLNLNALPFQEQSNPAPFVSQSAKDDATGEDSTGINNPTGFRRPDLNVPEAHVVNKPIVVDDSGTGKEAQQEDADYQSRLAAQANLDQKNPGTWANVFPLLSHTVTQLVTKPLAALSDIERGLISSTSSNGTNTDQQLYKSVPIYNANGTLIDTKQELTDYGKSLDEGKQNDVLGKLVLGLDAYNNETDKANADNPLPHTLLGNTTSGIIGVAPDLAMSALFPEGEAEELAAGHAFSLKNAVWNPFTKYMAVKGAVQGYDQGIQQGDKPLDALLSSGEEAGSQAIQAGSMGLLGGIGGDIISPNLYKSLTEKGILSAGKFTKFGIDAATDAALFGGYPIASSLIQGKPVSLDEIESGIGTGIVFAGMKNLKSDPEQPIDQQKANDVLSDRQAIAMNNFANADVDAIKGAYELNTTSADLNAKAIEFAAQAKTETDPTKKAELMATASTLAKASDVKATANAVINDPEGFTNSIQESNLPDAAKQELVQKFDDVNNLLNPNKQQEEVRQNVVGMLDNKITDLQQSGTVDPINDPSSIDNLINLVNQRTDIQTKLLSDASKPQSYIPEPGEEVQAPNGTESPSGPESDNGADKNELLGSPSPVQGADDNLQVPGREGSGGDTGTVEPGKEPLVKPFEFTSKVHGKLDITPLVNGEFDVKFEDGTNLELSSKDIKEHFNFDTDKIAAPEDEAKLHSTDDERAIAKMYDDKVKELQTSGEKDAEIALYGPRTDAETFGNVNDPNNISNGIRLNYFRTGDGKNPALDTQADEINHNSFNGKEVVSPNDIAEFMIKHPGGAATYFTPAGNPELKAIADRYQELTGKIFTNKMAKRLATEFSNVGVGEIKAIQNHFEGEDPTNKIKSFINDELSQPGYNDVNEVFDRVKSSLDSYVEDPSNMFNMLHDVYQGRELSPEEIADIKETINEKKAEQLGNGTGGEDVADSSGGKGTVKEESGIGQQSRAADEYDSKIEDKKQAIKDAEKKLENKLSDLSKKNDLFEASGIKKSEEAQSAMFDSATNTEPENIAKILDPLRGNIESLKRELGDMENNREGVLAQAEAQTSILGEDDDMPPFQKGEGEKIPHERAAAIQDLMEKVFPNVETKFHTTVDDFASAAKESGIDTDRGNLPNAFVDENSVIHFNPESINKDTQIHEYGHILTEWAKKNAPSLYNRMIRFGNDAISIHAELKQNGYNLSGERLAEEAFVTMLGREGEGKLSEVLKNSGTRGTISKFINDVWIKFQRYVLEKTGYDITKFKNIKNMTINEFLDTINKKYLLSETKISDIGSNEYRDVSEQKTRPMRTPGETMAEYAKRLIDWEKQQRDDSENLPLQNIKTSFTPIRESIKELNKAYNEGYKNAKTESKEAFLEYDRYRRQLADEALKREKDKNKEKFGEYDRFQKEKEAERLKSLKDKYESKLQAEREHRQEQTQKLKDNFKNIRTEIKDIIVKLNRTGALGGIKFTDRQLLSFADQLNNVKTEQGLDRFRDFISKAVTNADYLRDVNESKSLSRDAKKLLKADYVPQNMKDAIRNLVTLNPYDITDIKKFRDILQDVNNSQRSKEFANHTESEINDFINEEKDHDINRRAAEVLSNHGGVYYGDDHTTYKNTQVSSLPDPQEMRYKVRDVVGDSETTYNEKVRKLNNLDAAVNLYGNDVKDATRINPDGNIEADRPAENFNNIMDKVSNKSNELSESLRDHLENLAGARQDMIEVKDDMSPEQKQSLEILKKVPLAGQDANTLRLFNNVLDNVVNNDNHSGVGIFEAKAIGNSDDGALKLVNYLDETGKKSKDATYKTKLGEIRGIAASLSVILARIANNDFTFLSKLNTGTHFDEIRNGFAQAKTHFDEVLARKLEHVFKENPTVAKDPEAVQRLSLFSYLNQNREFSSPEQQDAELQKRITTIQKDIQLKSTEGVKDDKGEAAIEKHIYDGIVTKIKDATGVDINNPEDLKNLKYSDFTPIQILEPGEKAVYDTYRNADAELRPAHQNVVERQLNLPYEAWNNHMRDGYRFLGSGLVDVVTGDSLGFNAVNENLTDGSSATIQRVKGDPLAQKSGEKQKVLNLNFFDNQNQNIKDMLFDIHTLKNRQIFDEALKNPQLRDALGNENHQMYKQTVRDNVLSEMGLNKSSGQKEFATIKKGLNIINKVATFRQLLSLSTYIKHGGSTIFNTVANLGTDAGLMYNALHVMGTDGVKDLIKQHPISERAENLASLNTLSQKGLSDVNNTVVGEDGRSVIQATIDHASDLVDKYLLNLNSDGTANERAIAAPIRYGDVKSAELAWVSYYAQDLINKGIAPDFKSIDWSSEAKNPNREAADYAENMTSKQRNENTPSGRSKLTGSNDLANMAIKSFLFPFGSFNMHKFQIMAENIRTIASKDTFVNEDYRKDQSVVAAKSLMAGLIEESFFAGSKLAIGYGFAALAQKGIAYVLSSLFGSDDEKKQVMDKINAKLDQKQENGLQQWYSNTLSGYFFGGLGSTPEELAKQGINKLTNSEFFFEPNIPISSKIQDGSNMGQIGSALNGTGDEAKDLYRAIDPTDKFGVHVNITPYQKAVFAASALSQFLSFAGLNDADLNRSVDALRKGVEYNLASKFHEPNYEDLSQPSPVKIAGKDVRLSAEHQSYYEQQKESLQEQLEKKGMVSKSAATVAANMAKERLFQKFGPTAILKDGEVVQKKK